VVLLSPHPQDVDGVGIGSGVLGPGLTCERLTPLRLSDDLNCRPGPRVVPGATVGRSDLPVLHERSGFSRRSSRSACHPSTRERDGR
jgi:hypothetical protein